MKAVQMRVPRAKGAHEHATLYKKVDNKLDIEIVVDELTRNGLLDYKENWCATEVGDVKVLITETINAIALTCNAILKSVGLV